MTAAGRHSRSTPILRYKVGDTFVIIQAQGGTVSGTFADLPQGATLTVGDALFRIGYGTDDVVLTEVETPTIDANADLYLSELGQTLTLDATVSGTAGTPTGTVTFYDGDPSDGGQPLGSPVSIDASGQAGLSTSSLAIGEHTIYAVYSGDFEQPAGHRRARPRISRQRRLHHDDSHLGRAVHHLRRGGRVHGDRLRRVRRHSERHRRVLRRRDPHRHGPARRLRHRHPLDRDARRHRHAARDHRELFGRLQLRRQRRRASRTRPSPPPR